MPFPQPWLHFTTSFEKRRRRRVPPFLSLDSSPQIIPFSCIQSRPSLASFSHSQFSADFHPSALHLATPLGTEAITGLCSGEFRQECFDVVPEGRFVSRSAVPQAEGGRSRREPGIPHTPTLQHRGSGHRTNHRQNPNHLRPPPLAALSPYRNDRAPQAGVAQAGANLSEAGTGHLHGRVAVRALPRGGPVRHQPGGSAVFRYPCLLRVGLLTATARAAVRSRRFPNGARLTVHTQDSAAGETHW